MYTHKYIFYLIFQYKTMKKSFLIFFNTNKFAKILLKILSYVEFYTLSYEYKIITIGDIFAEILPFLYISPIIIRSLTKK